MKMGRGQSKMKGKFRHAFCCRTVASVLDFHCGGPAEHAPSIKDTLLTWPYIVEPYPKKPLIVVHHAPHAVQYLLQSDHSSEKGSFAPCHLALQDPSEMPWYVLLQGHDAR